MDFRKSTLLLLLVALTIFVSLSAISATDVNNDTVKPCSFSNENAAIVVGAIYAEGYQNNGSIAVENFENSTNNTNNDMGQIPAVNDVNTTNNTDNDMGQIPAVNDGNSTNNTNSDMGHIILDGNKLIESYKNWNKNGKSTIDDYLLNKHFKRALKHYVAEHGGNKPKEYEKQLLNYIKENHDKISSGKNIIDKNDIGHDILKGLPEVHRVFEKNVEHKTDIGEKTFDEAMLPINSDWVIGNKVKAIINTPIKIAQWLGCTFWNWMWSGGN